MFRLGDLLRQKLDAGLKFHGHYGDIANPQQTIPVHQMQPTIPSDRLQFGNPVMGGQNLQGGDTNYDGGTNMVQPSLKADALYRLKLR